MDAGLGSNRQDANGSGGYNRSSRDLIEAVITDGSASHGRAFRSLARGASRSTKTKVKRANDLQLAVTSLNTICSD